VHLQKENCVYKILPFFLLSSFCLQGATEGDTVALLNVAAFAVFYIAGNWPARRIL